MADSSPPPKADPDPNPLPPSPSPCLPPPLSDPNPPPKPDPDPTPNPPSPSSLPPPLSDPNPPPKPDPDPTPNPLPPSSLSGPNPPPKADPDPAPAPNPPSPSSSSAILSPQPLLPEPEPKALEEYVNEWKERRKEEGVDERDCALPFLTHEPKLVECKLCFRSIYPKEEIRCTVSGCQSAFHLNCAEKSFKISKEKISTKDERNSKKRKKLKGLKFEGLQFKCPQHGCFVCKQIGYWRCVRCMVCSHTKCAPWCERVIIPPGQHARAVCWKHPSDWLLQSQVSMHVRSVGTWKHPSDWLLQSQHADVTQSIQEVFDRLPVPYFEEEFNFSTGTNNADVAEKKDDTADMNDDVADSNADVAEKKDDTAEMNDDLAERNDDMANMNDDMAARNDASEKNDDVADMNDDVAEINDVVMENDDLAEKIDVVMENDDVAEKIDVVMKNDDVAQVNDVIMKNDDLVEINDVVMKIDDVAVKNNEPDPYVRIRRNIYLVKRKRESHAGVGCTGCTSDSVCKEDCECRGLSVSCSKACHCSDFCTNKPFRKDKKIKIVKTEHCGWGVITLDPLEKGDFIVEYIGEVIDDITCEKRLWDIKKRGDFNFYMCEISKDFTIDATFKGNTSRFLNHSCDPNCKLEKWQVDGETRVGVFASRSIKIGEPLTYDYRFVHFGPMVVCKCGASNCQGFLGSKKIVNQLPINSMSQESIKEECIQTDEEKLLGWGQKTKRSEMTKIRNQTPSIDFQNLLIENQTPTIDLQNHLVTNQTSSNDSQNQLIRNQTPSNDSQNHLIRSQTLSNDSQNQLVRIQPPQNQSIRNQTTQNQLIRNQTPSNSVQNQSSNDFQNRFDTNRVEISRSIRVKEDRPLSWGRRIKRSYTVSVDQNGSGN